MDTTGQAIAEGPPGAAGGRRARNASAKRREILDGARTVFMKNGFGDTSMDAVAEAAGVSKMTVYRHFNSKEELFAGLIAHLCDRMLDDGLEADMSSRPPREALRHYAERFIDTVFAPETIVLHRIVVAETERFPELGRRFYDCGPAQSIAALAAYFASHRDHPDLEVSDPGEAAEQFLEMLRGYEHLRVLLGVGPPPDRAALMRRAERVIGRFLRSN